MKILSIGNSYSQDGQRYLYAIAKANGQQLLNVNLHIGGCPLRNHYLNMLDDVQAYGYEFRGEETGLLVSIREALKSSDWDYVTLQQASRFSFLPETYTPYLEELRACVARYAPKAKLLLHQTWAYPDDPASLGQTAFPGPEAMFSAVRDAYDWAAARIGAELIPSGEAMLQAYRRRPELVYRDPIHASLGFGRYLLGLVWYRKLFGLPEEFRHITEFDVPLSGEERELAREIAFG